MNDLFENVWGDRSEIIVDHCLDITLPVRFLRLGLVPDSLTFPPDCALRHWGRR